MTTPDDPTTQARGRIASSLHGWTHPAILGAAALSVAAGFAQFGAAAALGDVAATFGEVVEFGESVADQAGLSGRTLGLGLAIIRFASLGGLLLSALADSFGRRRVLLACSAGGLAITALAAASPSYWWFVALFALARPMLSATNAVAGVIAAEETATSGRAKAIALITAGYGVGAGLTALLRGLFGELLGFRLLFALSIIPLLLVPLIGRLVEEPERFKVLRSQGLRPGRVPVLDVMRNGMAGRTILLAVLTFSISFIAGPVNGLLFVFGENVLGVTRATTAFAVLAAAPIGLTGLLIGRWLADVWGRRHTAVATQVLTGVAGALTYIGSPVWLIGGYLFGIMAASAFAPATGAMAAELYPTRVRGTAAGWLTAAGVLGGALGFLAFGVLVDVFDSFAPAAAIVAAPSVVLAPLFWRLGETRDSELEDAEA